MMTLHETVPSPARIGVELMAIAEGAPLALDLRIESVSEGVLVTGTVSAPTTGECARCLTPITGDVEIDLTELFAYPDSATEATTDADEVGHVVDNSVDLEQPIVDAVGLALPFSPLCGPDCQGLCPDCGIPMADRRTRTPPREDRPALGEALLDAGDRRQVTADRAALLKALGVELPDDLLTMALTHRSYSYENGGLPTNERLEFLGDAVLGLTITEELYHRHPDRSEGDLAKLRASIVNTQALADVGRAAVRRRSRRLPAAGQGRGELRAVRDKSSILADGVESLLGAIYLEHGLSVAREVILRLFGVADRHGADAGCWAGLEEQPAGADRRARHGCAVATW